MYLMTVASFPCGMLIPILYVSLVGEMVGPFLIVVTAFTVAVYSMYIQSELLLGLVCSLLSWCLFFS